jgi:hypothetical protein
MRVTIPAAAMFESRPRPKSALHTKPVSAMMRGIEPREEGEMSMGFWMLCKQQKG